MALGSARSGTPTERRLTARQQQVGALLNLIDEGDGNAVETFWREQMLRTCRAILAMHAGKTLVDVP